MDAPAPAPAGGINRWLPYWAVFQMDLRETLRSWLFRIWLLTALVVSVGYLLHQAAVHHEAGIIHAASALMTDVLQYSLLVGTTLTIILTAGAISSERGVIADSVLSRGISRYQYFLGKWHARLVTTLGSFVLIAGVALVGSCFLLQFDVSILGSLLALALVAAMLGIVVSCGVAMSSLCNSTVMGIAILWMLLHGVGVALAIFQYGPLNPVRVLRLVPLLLQGQYDAAAQANLIGWCALISVCTALPGLVVFARRDV
jgi:ABC-type transport system involved in multi-copper enzyme maturation permease subunit